MDKIIFGIWSISVLSIAVGFLVFKCILNKIEEKKHPDLFNLINEKDKLEDECFNFYNSNILPLRKEIDCAVEKQKYMTKERAALYQDNLESTKIKLEEQEMIYNKLTAEKHLLENEINTILKSNKKLFRVMKFLGYVKKGE